MSKDIHEFVILKKGSCIIMLNMLNQDKKFYLIVFFTLVIMFGFGFLPPFGQITTDGMRILGIFLGCIFAWCFGEIVWSSILGLVSLAFFQFGTMQENFVLAYANSAAATLIVAIVFCYAVEKSGLLSEIAKWIIGMKWAQKSPWRLVFAYYLAAIVVGAMAANVVVPIVLLWALFYEMAKEIDIKPQEPLSIIFLCGIGVNALIGVAMMPYGFMTVIVKGAAEAFNPDFVFNIGQYMLLNILVGVIYLPLIVLILRLIFGKKIRFNQITRDRYKIKLNLESKISLTALIAVILCMLIPNFLSANNPIRVMFSNNLTIVGIFMIASAILMIIHVHGNPVLDIVEGIKKHPLAIGITCMYSFSGIRIYYS